MKHKHHIIPKHMGGTDDPSNLIELTVEEHAEAHRLLYEKYGKWEDYYAWQGLAGIIPKSELVREIQRVANTGKFMSEETREKIRQANIGKKHKPETIEKNRQWHLGKKLSKQTKEKISEANRRRVVTDSHKKKTSDKLSKHWSITTPEGDIIIIKNLRLFCKENNLDQGNMSRGGHKGWKCHKLES
jgi:hypothetical protein